jgi:hypothetical protein
VSRLWLTYKSRNRLIGVVILDSSHLIDARMHAAVEGIDQGANFTEGHELDRGIPKRPAAASVRRMVKFAFESPLLLELRRRNSILNIQAKAINWAMLPMRSNT